MKVAVSQPETVFHLYVDIPFILEESYGPDPIPAFKVVMEGGHFFLRDFVEVHIIGLGIFNFGLRYRCSWSIHLNYSKYLICSYNFINLII